ncbi:IclR family transcriptional regulator [Pseudonocardia acaciae]|uniref:IclR family transcriptional regulator n=1 Tax=Pseudonocardia acaciae TaxID=551276 RepID=UPI0007E8E83E|nr:IclR family transcriptional regulator [Pseudonocardia acaciae]
MNNPQSVPSGDVAGTRIQSVARASQLLLWIAQQPRGATAKEVSVAQRLALPTVYHLVNTLVDQGLLTKDASRRYVLGRSASIIAQAYLRGKSVSPGLLAAVRELAERSGETAYLADWGENDIRVLASVESSQLLRVAEVASGPYQHGHARANGKVLLAYAWPEIREAYLRAHPPVALTQATIHDRAALEREFARIRRRGYAYDREEYALGVSCVAAPLLHDGHIVAAFGITVPTERFKRQRQSLTATLLDVVAGADRMLDMDDPDARQHGA